MVCKFQPVHLEMVYKLKTSSFLYTMIMDTVGYCELNLWKTDWDMTSTESRRFLLKRHISSWVHKTNNQFLNKIFFKSKKSHEKQRNCKCFFVQPIQKKILSVKTQVTSFRLKPTLKVISPPPSNPQNPVNSITKNIICKINFKSFFFFFLLEVEEKYPPSDWGCCALSSTRRLADKMDSIRCQEMENVMQSERKLKLECHWTFQQNNDSKYISKSTQGLVWRGRALERPSQ